MSWGGWPWELMGRRENTEGETREHGDSSWLG